MNILLSGATGFIGRNLLERMSHRFLCIGRTPLPVLYPRVGWASFKDENLEEKIEAFRPDVAIHLAARYQGGTLEEYLQANVEFGARFAEVAERAKVSRFIHTQSYMQFAPAPSFYAASKNAFAEILKAYRFPSVEAVILHDTFGPHDLRPKLIPTLLKHKTSGKSFHLQNPGKVINLTHIYDIVRGFEAIVNSWNPCAQYVLGNQCYQIRQVVEAFLDVHFWSKELPRTFEVTSDDDDRIATEFLPKVPGSSPDGYGGPLLSLHEGLAIL
jgi:nucleoside-diphosphate-sugar epimerase